MDSKKPDSELTIKEVQRRTGTHRATLARTHQNSCDALRNHFAADGRKSGRLVGKSQSHLEKMGFSFELQSAAIYQIGVYPKGVS